MEIKKLKENIYLFTLKNEFISVSFTNYGGYITNILVPDINGKYDDVVLGYDSIEGYLKDTESMGALVGRVANRIKKGHFILNNKEYHLAINNGPNHLHGGIKGFSQQIFDYEVHDEQVTLTYLSKDLEEGYPGNLLLKAKYYLKDKALVIEYEASTDQDTLINITNHSYFNLSGGKSSITKHQLMVKANQIACVDQDGLPTGKFLEVEKTPFDFNELKEIGLSLKAHHSQIILGNGLDHPYLLSTTNNQVILYDPCSKRQLTVSTTLPSAQIYTANFLKDVLGKNQQLYQKHDGICIETQFLPDAIHIEEHPSTILRKGETFKAMTSYCFKVV